MAHPYPASAEVLIAGRFRHVPSLTMEHEKDWAKLTGHGLWTEAGMAHSGTIDGAAVMLSVVTGESVEDCRAACGQATRG